MYGATIKLQYKDGYPPVINNASITKKLSEAAIKVAGKDQVIKPYLSMGGEDFSYFANEVPGCFFFLGSNPNKNKINTPHHCSHFNINEKSLIIGSSIFVQLIEDLLIKN